jgi:hypothetical protein
MRDSRSPIQGTYALDLECEYSGFKGNTPGPDQGRRKTIGENKGGDQKIVASKASH